VVLGQLIVQQQTYSVRKSDTQNPMGSLLSFGPGTEMITGGPYRSTSTPKIRREYTGYYYEWRSARMLSPVKSRRGSQWKSQSAALAEYKKTTLRKL